MPGRISFNVPRPNACDVLRTSSIRFIQLSSEQEEAAVKTLEEGRTVLRSIDDLKLTDLPAAAMYADAGNRLRNSGNWDKEDADYKQKIAEKKKAADAAKQELDDMQEDARKAGVPSSVRESSTAQQ